MPDMAGSFPADLTVLRNEEPEYDRARAVFNLAGVPAPAKADQVSRFADEVIPRTVASLSQATDHGRWRDPTA